MLLFLASFKVIFFSWLLVNLLFFLKNSWPRLKFSISCLIIWTFCVQRLLELHEVHLSFFFVSLKYVTDQIKTFKINKWRCLNYSKSQRKELSCFCFRIYLSMGNSAFNSRTSFTPKLLRTFLKILYIIRAQSHYVHCTECAPNFPKSVHTFPVSYSCDRPPFSSWTFQLVFNLWR